VIILGIAPGIRTLAWSVLDFPDRTLRADCLDCDVEHHGARGFSLETFEDMLARAKVHWLILTVLLGRHEGAVLVLGPQADRYEPEEHAEAARCLLRTLCMGAGVPVLEIGTRDEVLDTLGVTHRQITAVAEAVVGRRKRNGKIHLPSRSRPIVATFVLGAAAGRVLLDAPPLQLTDGRAA
jgi:hypothetical protein